MLTKKEDWNIYKWPRHAANVLEMASRQSLETRAYSRPSSLSLRHIMK